MDGVKGELLLPAAMIVLKMEFSELPLIFLNGVELLCVEYTGEGIDCGDNVEREVLMDSFDKFAYGERGVFDAIAVDGCRQKRLTLLMNWVIPGQSL